MKKTAIPFAVEVTDDGCTTKYLFTNEEALKFIRNVTGVKLGFAMHVSRDAPISNPDGSPTDRMFPSGFSTYINLSRKDAGDVVKRMKSDTLEARGARFPIEVRLVSYHGGFQTTTVWLG